jgi:hypothetical protein
VFAKSKETEHSPNANSGESPMADAAPTTANRPLPRRQLVGNGNT